MPVSRQQFKELVTDALSELPQQFSSKLENVVIVIEDFPAPSQLNKLGLTSPYQLFGLYEGIPKTRRTGNYALVAPDKITIFYQPIIRFFNITEDIKNQVKKTVMHEIGHHFGLSEDELP